MLFLYIKDITFLNALHKLTISEAAYKVVRIKESEKQATFSYNGSEREIGNESQVLDPGNRQ